jgi:integrase/recombinase XerC
MNSSLSTPTNTHTDLDTHHRQWTSANAKTRAAAAARDRDADTLWSLTAAMLAEGATVSPHTARSYRASVLDYIAWTTTAGVNVLRPAHGTGSAYRYHLTRTYSTPNSTPGGEPTVGVASVNARLTGARALYRAFAWVDLEHADPFVNVKRLQDKRAPETVRAAYSHGDVARLLDAADDPHDHVAVLLGAHAGLRAAEMLALTWDRVTMPDRNTAGEWTDVGALIVHGKGGTVRTVPAGDALLDALEALPDRSGPVLAHVRTGSGLRYRVARLAERAGLIDKARPAAGEGRTKNGKAAPAVLGLHRLRHRFGTDVVKAHGIAVGQTALRHASPVTTARYAKDRETEVAAFVRTLR